LRRALAGKQSKGFAPSLYELSPFEPNPSPLPVILGNNLPLEAGSRNGICWFLSGWRRVRLLRYLIARLPGIRSHSPRRGNPKLTKKLMKIQEHLTRRSRNRSGANLSFPGEPRVAQRRFR